MKNFGKKENLDVGKCLGSGQHFHWKKLEKGYGIVSGKNAWYLQDLEQAWGVEGSSLRDLRTFFNLETSYKQILMELEKDETLEEILEIGRGLRLLKQDPWEVIVAFILSTNNNISRIQKSVFNLSKEFGKEIANFEGQSFYSLPDPKTLSNLDPQNLREKAGTGYRDKYLVESAKLIHQGKVNLDKIANLTYEEALREIMKLPGVGKKAGDCILLFAFEFSQSFPVDVWIERIMQYLYGPFKTREEIGKFGRNKFGPQAGFVQQLFFHYIRTTNMKKSKNK